MAKYRLYLNYFNGKDWNDDNRLHQYFCFFKLDFDGKYLLYEIQCLTINGYVRRPNISHLTMYDPTTIICYLHAFNHQEALEIANTLCNQFNDEILPEIQREFEGNFLAKI